MNRGSGFLLGLPRRPQLFVCLRCRNLRSIATSFLEKKERGRQKWAKLKEDIVAGRRKGMLDILEERGYVNAVTGDRKTLHNLMIDKRIGIYVGIDPTASSLHVGHMLPLMALFWMHLHGFHTVSLIGGATAKIGDPTGRTADRPIQSSTERKANLASIHYQLKRIWLNLEKVGVKHGYEYDENWHREIVNNAMWWNKNPMLDVLKLMGHGFRIGAMMGRDTVKTKMESKDGMSFSEFCYPIMQAWDWWEMYTQKGVQMQIGGSDQYGNILAGLEAVKHVVKTHPDPDIREEGGVSPINTPYGITVPLLTTSSGEKFGKSAGNAIWLDQQLTSLYDLYGFFLRTSDEDVSRYLKLFTFLPLEDIDSICKMHEKDASKRVAQHKLAREFIELIHGEKAAEQAESQHAAFRTQTISSLLASNPADTSSSVNTTNSGSTTPQNPLLSHPHPRKQKEGTFLSPSLNPFASATDQNTQTGNRITLPKSLIYQQPISRVLYHAGLVSSRSEGHRLAANKGAHIGYQPSNKGEMGDQLMYTPAKLHDPVQTWRFVIRNEGNEAGKPGEEGVLILRVGKWKVRIIRIVSDELFETLGIDPAPPGWSEYKAQQVTESGRDALDAAVHERSSWKSEQAASRAVVKEDVENDEDNDVDLSPWEKDDKEMAKIAGQDLKPWDSFQTTAKPPRKDKESWSQLKNGQHKAMEYFRKQGVSAKDIRKDSYLGWNQGSRKERDEERARRETQTPEERAKEQAAARERSRARAEHLKESRREQGALLRAQRGGTEASRAF